MATAELVAETPVAAEVAELVARSRAAQQQIENATQEQVDTWIKGMVYAVCKPGMDEEIARETVEETQLGNYEGKFKKISVKTRATLMDIINDKSVGAISSTRPGSPSRCPNTRFCLPMKICSARTSSNWSADFCNPPSETSFLSRWSRIFK